MFDERTQSQLDKKILRELGPLAELLQNPTTTDIIRNPDGSLWLHASGEPKHQLDVTFSEDQAMRLIGSIAASAGTIVTAEAPLLQATLPGGARFQAMIPPSVQAPAFAIRCHSQVHFKLSDYIPDRMPESVAERLRQALRNRENVIISGGTGSGKTTLTGAMLLELATLCPDDRLCVMEDTRELPNVSADAVYEQTTKTVSMRALLATNLRMRPDRIILGEIRGQEALDLLKSWNTGHPGGITTVHANSARSALSRFEQLILEGHDLQLAYLRSLISDVVQLVVQIERVPQKGPVITALIEVTGLSLEGRYETKVLYSIK